MTDLADSVDSLKRIMARPGMFASLFPETTDTDLADTMVDGLANAQLDGLLTTYTYDDVAGEVGPDLTPAQIALVTMYAGAILLRAELFNRKLHRRYEASGAVFEEDQATNVLRDLLKGLEGRIKAIVEVTSDAGAGAAFYMADAYVIRAIGGYHYDPVGW